MAETALYVAETVKYVILYRLVFEKKLKRPWIAVLFGVLFAFAFVIMWPEFDDSGKRVLSRTLAVVVLMGMQNTNGIKRGSDTVVVWLISLVVEKFLGAPLQILGLYKEIGIQWKDIMNVAVTLFECMLFLLVYVWKRKRITKVEKELSKRKLYCLVLFMVVVMFVTASGFGYASKYVPIKWFPSAVILLTTASYFAIGLLGVFVVHIRRVNEKLDEMLQNEIILKKAERSYYETLLEKEEETRRYRHDMVGHLVCMNAFAAEQKTEELQEYLQKLQQQFVKIQNKCYVTGNIVLDAITNHYLMEIESEMEVQVKGQLHCALAVDDVALCTIYDNLLKNAIEELERIEEGEKSLLITFSQGENVSEIRIQNSISVRSREKERLLVTEKEDKQSHGLGLKNVNRVVQECGGSLRVNREEGFFTVCFRTKNRKN